MRRYEARCSVCRKLCDFQYRSFYDWTYKIKIEGKYLIQCSYSCWRKEKGRNTIDGRK